MSSNNVLVLGCGALGSYVAAKISQNGIKPTILARGNYQAVKANGLQISEADRADDFKVHPTDFTVLQAGVSIDDRYDIVILCTQTTQNEDLYSTLIQCMQPSGTLVTLQNGFNFEPGLAMALPGRTIVSGTAWVKVTTISSWHTRHDFGLDLILGQYDQQFDSHPLNDKALYACDMLRDAGFVVTEVESVKSAQWTKLILNIPFFVTCARLGKSISEVLHNSDLESEMMQLHTEMLEKAKLLGASPDEQYILRMIDMLRGMKITPLKSAEKFLHRMVAELEPNAGNVLAFSQSRGVEMPKLKFAYEELCKLAQKA